MRIAVVFSSYQESIPSGEREVVMLQIETLKSHGHDVLLVRRTTPNQNLGLRFRINSFFTTSLGYGHSPMPELIRWNPQVVVIHNLHPNYGKKWIRNLKRKYPEVLVCFYVHNFRGFCSSGTLIRRGKFCTKCVSGSRLYGFLNRCYRNSFLGSFAFFVSFLKESPQKDVFNHVDLVVYINDKVKKLYELSGIRIKRGVTISNYQKRTEILSERSPSLDPRYYFAGRLSPEKGIIPLVKAWPGNVGLDIFGDGPERLELEKLIRGKSNINYHGIKSVTELESYLVHHNVVVLPSICMEMAPLVVQTALVNSRAILCLKINKFWENSDLIPGVALNSLEESEVNKAILLFNENLVNYSNDALKFYEQNYTPEIWYDSFIKEIGNEPPISL